MRVEYDFLRVGSFVEPRRGHIFVDVGNQNVPGVIDTHTDALRADRFECSSSLIVANPSLVTDWISGEDLQGPVHVVMHENPDYDCIASSLLVRKLLEAQAAGKTRPDGWDEWAPVIANSARRIDRGETRLLLPISKERVPITPYLSLIGLHEHVAGNSVVPRESWHRVVQEGQVILEDAIRLAVERGDADLERIDLRGSLPAGLESLIDVKVQAFQRDARRIGLGLIGKHLPKQLDGVFHIELPQRSSPSATAAAAIACIRDPECGAGFFKSVIRGTYSDSIQATCVFLSVPADPISGSPAWSRPIISVDPDSPFDLRGLGRHLDVIETEAREKAGKRREGRRRPGFDNSDPWYDGRALEYTIVDAPRWGTVLTPERVLGEVLDVHRWLSARIPDLVEGMLGAIAFPAQDDGRRAACRDLAAALGFWRKQPGAMREQLYVHCVDAVAGGVVRDDADRVLLDAGGDDVLLALLASRDPAVRVQALLSAARDAARVTSYALECGREDVAALLRFITGDERDAARRLATAAIRAEHALLLDAVTVRLRMKGVEDSLIQAAAALSWSNSGVQPLWRSIFGLWSAVREIDAAEAALLERAARRVVELAMRELALSPVARELVSDAWRLDVFGVRAELERRAAQGGGIERMTAQSISGVESVELRTWRRRLEEGDGAGELRAWIANGRTADAAGILILLLASGEAAAIASDRREVLLTLAGELLERTRRTGDAPASLVRELVRRLRNAFGTSGIGGGLSEAALTAALQHSPECAGALVREAAFSGAARWALLRAAIAGTSTIAAARPWVLTPEDWRTWQNVQALTQAAAAARSGIAGAAASIPAGHARCAVLLLATAAAARGLREGPAIELLTATASAADLQAAVDSVAATRGLIVDELRHVSPDHALLADAEMSLTKTEIFARSLELLSPDQPSDEPVRLLLRFAMKLPELDVEAVAELLKLHCSRRGELEPPWTKCAFDVADAVGSVLHGGQLVTESERIRRVCASLASVASSIPDDSIGWLVGLAARDTEQVLHRYAAQLERAAAERDSLSRDVLQASTLAAIASGFCAGTKARKGSAVIDVLAALVQRDGEGTEVWSRVRRCERTAGDGEAWATAAMNAVKGSGKAGLVPVDQAYQRLRELFMIPRGALDAAYARSVAADIADYEIAGARKRIDSYSVAPAPPLLSFWMSGWAIAVPAVFMALFVAAGASHEPTAAQYALELGIWILMGAVAASIVLEWRRRRRTPSEAVVDVLRYKLFLPHYGVPVLIGVYSAAMSHEMSGHLARQLDDPRYIALGLGLFLAAGWALRQVVRRENQKVSGASILTATGRLFAYGFVIALLLNLLLGPLLSYEAGLHHLFVELIDDDSLASHGSIIPDKVSMSMIFPKKHPLPLFPRHIVLDALFGMFVGIFLHRFLGHREEHE